MTAKERETLGNISNGVELTEEEVEAMRGILETSPSCDELDYADKENCTIVTIVNCGDRWFKFELPYSSLIYAYVNPKPENDKQF